MEILFISHKYPPGVGGMQKQSFELVEGFKKNHKVHLITYNEKDQSKFRFFVGLRKRVNTLLTQNPDIQLVHCNDGVCAFFCQWIQRKHSIPVLLTFHGLDLLWPNPVYQRMIGGLMKKFSGVIAVSDYTASECERRNIDKEKIHVVYNGVDTVNSYDRLNVDNSLLQLFSELRKNDKKILLSIGRPVRRKGFSWFVRNVLADLDDSYHYVVIGPGTNFNVIERFLLKLLPSRWKAQLYLFFGWSSDQLSLIDLKQNNDSNNRFIWMNKLSYASILFALENSDLFVMPNIKVKGDAEGFGLVALESIVQGTYVLAADTDGIPSAVRDRKNGRIVESGNAVAWTEAIQIYFELDESTIKAMVARAQSFVNNYYKWDNMVEAYETVFNHYVNKYERVD